MRLTATVQINAPAETVFACVDEPDRIVAWVEGAIEHRYTSPRGASAVGQTFHQIIMQGPKRREFDGTVIAFTPPSHFAFTIPSPAYSSEVHFRITPLSPASCRVDYAIDVTLHTALAKLVGTLLRFPLGGFVRKQMNRLKALAEQIHAG